MLSKLIVVVWAFCLAVHADMARAHPCHEGAELTGAQVLNPVRVGFQKAGDVRTFRLADVHVPEALAPPPAARLAVRKAVDRYGRQAVHVFDDKSWWQGRLLKRGEAIVVAGDASTACLAALRAAESEARKAQRGVWQRPAFQLKALNHESMEPLLGQFVVITGSVASVGDRKRRLYLNFGQNWEQDFTVSVVKSGRGAFKERKAGALARLQALTGKTVRVRGVLEQRQGPLIRLADEAQIEILE